MTTAEINQHQDAIAKLRNSLGRSSSPEIRTRLLAQMEVHEAAIARLNANPSPVVSGYQPGSSKVHAIVPNGRHSSGAVRYRKLCGTNRRDRYLPSPTGEPTEITCQRCLAAIAKRGQS